MPDLTDISIPAGSKIQEVSIETNYDVIILGAGPAGLTAAVYTMRKGMNSAILTNNIGGQVIETAGIENYMGYRFIEGTSLIDKFFEQIKQFPIGFKQGVKAGKIIKEDNLFKLECSDKNTYSAKSVIIATGKSPRRLNIPGETEFTGKGVAYCSICDAPLFSGLDVAVVGGGNSAIESAIDLCKIAKNVHIIQFLPEFTADEILVKKLSEFNNFNVHFNCQAKKIIGETLVKQIEVMKNDTKEIFTIDVDGVFVAIGWIPNTSVLEGFVNLNRFNEIIVDCGCNTSVKGLFAAGDVTSVPVKQIIVAAGEGAKAAIAAHKYLLNA